MRIALSMLALLTITACGNVAPTPTTVAESSCANGVKPGCGPCYPDSSSPRGGYETCWTCDGDSVQRACVPPPPCGYLGEPCCDPTYAVPSCFGETVCGDNGTCIACGGTYEPCCDGSACDSPLHCGHYSKPDRYLCTADPNY